ncbi:MAG: hypothetical protein ACT4PS_03875 [Betaproteobacteria bacterium]
MVFGEALPQRDWRTLIEQDPHPDRVSRGLNAASCVLEDGINLLARGTREPLQKLVDCRAAFEIFKQRAYRDPRAAKNPRAAEFLWVALNGRTGIPIKHCHTLPERQHGEILTFA